jgi:hypothetical protein
VCIIVGYFNISLVFSVKKQLQVKTKKDPPFKGFASDKHCHPSPIRFTPSLLKNKL